MCFVSVRVELTVISWTWRGSYFRTLSFVFILPFCLLVLVLCEALNVRWILQATSSLSDIGPEESFKTSLNYVKVSKVQYILVFHFGFETIWNIAFCLFNSFIFLLKRNYDVNKIVPRGNKEKQEDFRTSWIFVCDSLILSNYFCGFSNSVLTFRGKSTTTMFLRKLNTLSLVLLRNLLCWWNRKSKVLVWLLSERLKRNK